ncbi:MAG: hypothetical protein IKK45_07465 [Akkermansia sp.]|nr:hypothetical protein [Akkermansia sp.]
MRYILSSILLILALVLPSPADSLVSVERLGIINITFSEPVVSATTVANQFNEQLSPKERGLELFTITGDKDYPPDARWVAQDCLRIVPATGSTVQVEYALNFKPDTRYLSGRPLQNYAYTFRTRPVPLVSEEAPGIPGGAMLVCARPRISREALNLSPASPIRYTFTRMVPDGTGERVPGRESVEGIAEPALLRHGCSYSVLSALRRSGARWEELTPDTPISGYVLVRPARRLPEGSEWRLTATVRNLSGFLDSKLGEITITHRLQLRAEQVFHPERATSHGNSPETRVRVSFSAEMDKTTLPELFRHMEVYCNGIKATPVEGNPLCVEAQVEGKPVRIHYAGPSEATSMEVSGTHLHGEERILYTHPQARPGMELTVETARPFLLELRFAKNVKSLQGMELQSPTACRLSITPAQPCMPEPDTAGVTTLPLHGKHKLQIPYLNGAELGISLHRWSQEQATTTMGKMLDIMRRQKESPHSKLMESLYLSALIQARQEHKLPTEDLPTPEEQEAHRTALQELHTLQQQVLQGSVSTPMFRMAAPSGDNRLAGHSRVVVELPQLLQGEALRPGLYVLRLRFTPNAAVRAAAEALGIHQELLQREELAVLQVTDLQLRLSTDDSLALLTRFSTGKPEAEGQLQALGRQGLFGSAFPTPHGTAQLRQVGGEILMATHGEDYCFAPRYGNNWLPDWADDDTAEDPDAVETEPEVELKAMFWTDRRLYRPGETVHVRGFMRAVDKMNRFNHSKHKNLDLVLISPLGRELERRNFDVDAYGAFEQSFRLPAGQDNVAGAYRLRLLTPLPRQLATQTIRCEVFRRDTFDVQLRAMGSPIAPAQLELRLEAADYSGTPVANGRVQLEINAPIPLGEEGEALPDKSREEPNYTLRRQATLNADGTLQFTLPLPPIQKETTLHISGNVANAREEYRHFRLNHTLCPAGLRLKLTPDARLHLLDARQDTPLAEEQEVEVHLHGTREETRQLPNGFSLVTTSPYHLWGESVRVPAHSATGIKLPLHSIIRRLLDIGIPLQDKYTVTLSGKDSAGRSFNEQRSFYSHGQNMPPLFRLSQEHPGATPMLHSAMEGTAIAIVRCGVRTRCISIPVQKGEHPLSFTPEAEETGELQLQLLLPYADEHGQHTLLASTQAALSYPNPARDLEITLNVPAQARPGSTQDFSGQVRRPDGTPAQAVVTLYAVDAGILNLADYHLPNIAASLSRTQAQHLHFPPMLQKHRAFSFTPLPGLWRGESRPTAGGTWKREDFAGQLGHTPMPILMSAATATGMGADADTRWLEGISVLDEADEAALEQPLLRKHTNATTSTAEPLLLRHNFAPLALWQGALPTNTEGRFSTRTTLPHTLTTYRIFAVAADAAGTGFGTKEAELNVQQPLMLNATAPLFMSTGDRLQIPLTLTNNSSAQGTWKLAGSGTSTPQEITLAPHAEHTFHFEAAPDTEGDYHMQWMATGEGGQDATAITIPVRRPVPLLKEVHHLLLAEGDKEQNTASLLSKELANSAQGTLELRLSANPLLHMAGCVEMALQCPFGHTEQLASSMLPWLMYDRLAPLSPQMAATPAAQVPELLRQTMQRLAARRQKDGGLAYWSGGHESCLWASAHAAMVLQMAQQHGHTLPEGLLEGLQRYLSTAELKNASPLTRYQVARLKGDRSTMKSALAEAGKIAREAQQCPWWCSGSLTADITFLSYLMDYNAGRYEAFLTWMRSRAADPRHQSSWRSAWAITALMEYVGNSAGAVVESAVRLPNGQQLELQRGITTLQLAATGTRLADTAASITPLRGNTYAIVRATALPPQEQYPGITEKGLQITRLYEKQGEDGVWRPTSEWKVGDVVRITLTCAKTAPELQHFVLEDYLPASMEAINPALPTQAAGLPHTEWSQELNHREYLADRVRGFGTRWVGQGTLNMVYYARVKRAGTATAPPAQAQLFYEPQVYGLSSGATHISLP